MALAGSGAVCIWNGIAPEGRDTFYDWHNHEHMPERAAIDGFLRGRRYIAATPETAPEFFTVYETADVDVLTSAVYLARLNAPTEWTRRATAHFRDTSRALTRVVASRGPGQGGLLASVRILDTGAGQEGLASVLRNASGIVDTIARMPQITGAQICSTDTEASSGRTAESKSRTDIQTAPIGALLIEACNLDPLKVAVAGLAAVTGKPLAGAVIGYYRLEYECLKPR